MEGAVVSELKPKGGKPLNAWVRALANTASLTGGRSPIFPELLEQLADRFDKKPALISELGTLSYRDLVELSNRYSHWALANNVQPGDAVCLYMPNCPEYVAIWVGITRIGGAVALINTNLTNEALLHSINITSPKHLIVDTALASAVSDILPQLPSRLRCWVRGSTAPARFSDNELDIWRYPGKKLRHTERPSVSITDRALYIYTSGTTGLPKAANVSHFRILEWSYWFAGMMNVSEDDRMYDCIPMYHSTGGVVAIGAMLINGGSVVIRPTFSASRFWDDIVAADCTVFQYIGELCRYLVNQPVSPIETQHRLRLCCGNGMRRDVWEIFQKRFRIPQILEFYASTEGNVSLYNCEGRPGAIGRIPAFLAHRFRIGMIKCDDLGEPLRAPTGTCIPCQVDEVGEVIGQITAGSGSEMTRFDGYSDQRASDAKLLRSVFSEGDLWFRTGDLMRRDAAGFFYFVDRLGDTFRWKGENVSTTQVEEVISTCPGVSHAVVYGVSIPQAEGRAGMAAIMVEPGFSLTCLWEHLTDSLPEYARPRFIRICNELENTGTFKTVKVSLRNEGYDPTRTNDAIYVDDRPSRNFVRLDDARYAAIGRGAIRF